MQSADQVFPTGNNIRPPRKLGCAFILLPISAVILSILSIWYAYTSWNFYTKGVEVQGTVVRLEAHSSSDSGTTYSPVFSYTVNGQEYEYESVNSSDPPTHEVGEVSTLLYDPNNPAKAREKSFWELWLLPCILCPISILMVVLSAAIPMFVRRM
ncbi:MAG: DUF3592 domain-containing protein [Chloroflexi bacterium]|nr:DUF3592 domain-containing protein [Chloroflexota bacterium]MBI3169755.1 DUF3592 domain-containing protein [Chloroflexota bacterium]